MLTNILQGGIVELQSTKTGGESVTNTLLLNEIIEKSGLKYKSIASHLGVSYYTLHNKIYNKSEFKLSEIRKLCEFLKIDEEMQKQVFFIIFVDLKSTSLTA